MADRESTFRIAFDGEEGDIASVLSALKGKVRAAVADIQAIAAKIELFAKIEDDVKKAADAFTAAGVKVSQLKEQIDSVRGSGGTVGADLAKQFKLAENAAASASKEYNNQVTRLTALQAKLTGAGVDTAQLATEQKRLAVALKETTAAAAQQSAKDLLGFKTLQDVGPQITALNSAFNTLRTSGKLTASEIGAAQTLLAEKIAKVRGEVTGASQSFVQQASTVKSSFQGFQLQFLAVAAGIGSVVAGIKAVTDEARAFNQGIAEIGAITTLSKAQLAALGEEARTLARTLGFDVVEGVKQLQEILRSGIPADNAIKVLAESSEFAKIAQTDMATAVKLSTTLVKAFGVETDDLNRVLAIFYQSSRNGGPTLASLAQDLGKLGPIARSTNTPIEQVAAALQVMVKAGVPAGDAIGDLSKILVKFNSEPARKQLAALGITTDNFVEALVQIGEKGGPTIDELLDIGLASTKSVAGVSALTNNSRALTAALAAQTTATAEATKALEVFEQSPKERLELLKAAVSDFSITLGDSVGTSSKFAVVLARLLNLFNNLAPATRDVVAQQGVLALIMGPLGQAIGLAGQAYDRLTTSQTAAAAAAAKVADATANSSAALQKSVVAIQAIAAAQGDAAKKQLDSARASLQGFAADLQTQITAAQAASAAAIADLNARAAAQIAGLDRSTAAEKATAEATLAIHTKLAADRLAQIVKSSVEILKAIDVAGAAQLALVKDNAEKTRAVDLTVNQTKLAALAQYKTQLAAALSDAVAQEQGYVAKVNAIDASRVTFNQSVQQQLTDIRNEGLSGFDQYIARTKQINDLLAQAQKAFDQGGAAGLALGKSYVDQVIALSGQLKTVVNADGVVVVSAFELQQKKIEVITKAAKLYNEALDDQKAAANAGKDASVAAIDAITPKLADITARYDELAKKVEAGLAIKITLDEASIVEATQKINDAIAAQEYAAKITADVSAVQAEIDILVANLKRGVTDGADAQLQGIATALQKIAAEAPQLQVKIDDALAQVDALQVAVNKIELTPKLTIDSNVADVQKSIDNLKQPTESTHTVHIKVDGQYPGGDTGTPIPGLNRGGPVDAIERSFAPAREAWQRYASGGPVAPVPRGTAGGGVSYPAAASSGSAAPTLAFAQGGPVAVARRAAMPVREIWQAYARGGPVFPRLAGIKVPGTGNRDTVPASLQSGSFVLRKAASQFYGDATMTKLAAGVTAARAVSRRALEPAREALRRYAGGSAILERPAAPSAAPGAADIANLQYQPANLQIPAKGPGAKASAISATAGTVRRAIGGYVLQMLASGGTTFHSNDPTLGDFFGTSYYGDIPAGTRESDRNVGELDPPQLPSDPKKLATLVQRYVFDVAYAAIADDYFFWKPALRVMSNLGSAYESRPSADGLERLLRQARAIGLNLGVSKNTHVGFDVDGRTWHKSIAKDLPHGLSGPLVYQYDFYNQGGPAGTDTVAAMLTPGEYVINAPRAAELGTNFLHALNNMRIPRMDLDAIVNPEPPRRPQYLAQGGMVGDSWSANNSRVGVPDAGGVTINMNGTLGLADVFSVENLRRYFLPAIREIERRSK